MAIVGAMDVKDCHGNPRAKGDPVLLVKELNVMRPALKTRFLKKA